MTLQTNYFVSLTLLFIALSIQSFGQTNISQTEQAIESLRAEGKKNLLNQKLVEAAFYYWDNNNKEKAAQLFEESATISNEIGNLHGTANAYHNLGILRAEQKDFASSIELQKKAVSIKEKQGDQRSLANYLLNLGGVYLEFNQPEQAIKTLEKSAQLAKEQGITNVQTDSYLTLSQAYETLGKKEKALAYFKMYNETFDVEGQQYVAELKDDYEAKESQLIAAKQQKEQELVKKQQALKIAELQKKEAEAEARARQNEIELLNTTQELQQAELEASRKILGFAIGIVILILIFAVLMIRANKKMKFANERLESQKKELSTQRDAIGKKNVALDKAYKSIQASITYAERIQQASLPDLANIESAFDDSFVLFKPRDVVSGDFYWFAQLRNSLTGNVKKIIAAVDCTGHGVPGAFMSLVGNSALNQIIIERRITDPARILKLLNERIIEALKQEKNANQDGMDMALVVVDESEKKIEFAGAKNPLLFVKNGELHSIKGTRKPIGGIHFKDAIYEKHVFDIDETYTCYIFSDGYQDQFGDKDNLRFMSKRLKQLIVEINDKPMKAQKVIFEETFENWRGEEKQVDDILLIGFKIEPNNGKLR